MFPALKKLISQRRAASLRVRSALLFLLAASIGLAGPGAASAASVHLMETGSSLLYPLFNLWVPAWTAKHPDVRIDTASTGSGTGIAQAVEGIAQFGASDAYLSDAIMKKHPGMLNIPLAISSQMVGYNLPGLNDTSLKLDGPVLAGIYDGSIQSWDDARIKALNPGVKLPHQPVVPIRRADSSGDTFMFTQYLSATTPVWKRKTGYGTTVSWPPLRSAIGVNGNSGMVTALKTNPYSIAYIGVSLRKQIAEAGMGQAALKNHAGNFVTINARSVPAAAAAMVPKTPPDMRISMVNAPGADSYPIVNYEYVIVQARQPNAAIAAAMKDFLTWAVAPDGGNAPSYLRQVDFLALPESARELALKQIATLHGKP